MPINFPSNPSQNQTHTQNGKTWVFDGTSWRRSGGGAAGGLGYTGSMGPAGYTGSVGSFSGTTAQAIITTNVQSSTSTVTGALQVAGGAGVAGNLHLGGSFVVGGNILPTSNNTVSLGSPDMRFANLWVSANTVHIGDTSLSSTESGDLQIASAGGTPVSIIGPKIANLDYSGDDLAANPAGGDVVVINGSGFKNGAAVYVDGVVVGVVSVISGTQMSFITPAKASGSYTLTVVNSDGGTAIFVPGIQYSGMPNWNTAAGSLGSMYETTAVNYTLSANSDSAVNYTMVSGSLPTGSNLFSNGSIKGTAGIVNSSTTYSFTAAATDAENQNTNRSFSITVNPDVVSWTTPATSPSTYSSYIEQSYSQSLVANSAIGDSITYSANNLPAGITLTGNTLSGSFTTVQNVSATITATTTNSTKSNTTIINYTITAGPVGQVSYTTPGTYSWTAPAGVTKVSVVCVGAGGGYPGGGGGLGWRNNITVVPGTSYTVKVGGANSGDPGGESFFSSNSLVRGGGGIGGVGQSGGSYVGQGGGSGGGAGTSGTNVSTPGGGGAGGYSGNGGRGGGGNGNPGAGSGGGGGGGGYGRDVGYSSIGGGGGGVGIFGQGDNGAAGVNQGGGFGDGTWGGSGSTNIGNGVAYGNGGNTGYTGGSAGGNGAVRIIWGTNRSFPSTNTTDMS